MAASLSKSAVVLNVGAGPTPPPLKQLRGRVRKLVGVDPDPVVKSNTDLDEAFVNDGITLPFPENTFDVVYCDWTLEHVERPAPFLAEIYRVLKPGASFWFRTPNQLHYAGAIAAMTPHWFHRLVANPVRRVNHDAHDPWPTLHRMNRPGRLRRQLGAAGLVEIELRTFESHPGYLVFNAAAFTVGIAYERLVNHFAVLSRFRHAILGCAHKPIIT